MHSGTVPSLRTLRTANTSLSDTGFITAGFFQQLDEAAVAEVKADAKRLEVPAKYAIIHEGHPATHLYLIEAGGARYYKTTKDGVQVLISCVYPGDMCGMAAILDTPQGYIGSAESLLECQLLGWERTAILRLKKRYPQLVENVLAITMRYMRRYAKRMVRLTTRTAQQRLADALLRLAGNLGQLSPAGVEIGVTNEQLGWAADISEFTASRFLNEWERVGWISKDRGRVIIHIPQALVLQ